MRPFDEIITVKYNNRDVRLWRLSVRNPDGTIGPYISGRKVHFWTDLETGQRYTYDAATGIMEPYNS